MADVVACRCRAIAVFTTGLVEGQSSNRMTR